MSTSTIDAADLFCGAGGTSSGLRDACRALGVSLNLTAINHWNVAIRTHTANHPDATHLCESLDSVSPRQVIRGGRLNLLVASPECIHHSNARGGRPINDQSRASAWHVIRWAESLQIDNILLENVPEFTSWGPIGSNGRPLKSKRGRTFDAFLRAMESLGYVVDYRVLNAADYGEATSRKRLFIQARRGRRKIVWPEPTHSRAGMADISGRARQQWRAAREVIDWGIPGNSIFDREKPLAATTIARIESGLRKFGGPAAEPFLVVLRNNGDARSLDLPLPTVTAGGQHFGICEPFIMTVNHGDEGPSSRYHRVHSLNEPIPTLTTQRAHALVEPFVVTIDHGSGDPGCRAHSLGRPLTTMTTKNAHALVEPILVQYNGTADARPVSEPVGTLTTKARFGLAEPVIEGRCLDIRFRMLQTLELARAMGFDDSYEFAGNQAEVTKQIGNAVSRRVAKALCQTILETERAFLRKAA